MFNYFFDTNDYTEILQYLSLFLLFVIATMIYYLSTSADRMNLDIKNELSNLEFPKCPDHPNIPSCPKCPDLNCSNEGKCPECPENKDCPVCPTIEVDCPTVGDIVSGIFPGRNPGITSGGKYFDIMANDSYELMPDYDFYSPASAFPGDSILSAPDSLIKGNIDVPSSEIDNSNDNTLVNTSEEVSLTRMNMANRGESTGADSLPTDAVTRTGSTPFGQNSTRVSGGLTNAQRQRMAAEEEGITDESTLASIASQQASRDAAEADIRSDLTQGGGE